MPGQEVIGFSRDAARKIRKTVKTIERLAHYRPRHQRHEPILHDDIETGNGPPTETRETGSGYFDTTNNVYYIYNSGNPKPIGGGPSSLGTPNQLYGMNPAGTAGEYKTLTTTGIFVTHSAGSLRADAGVLVRVKTANYTVLSGDRSTLFIGNGTIAFSFFLPTPGASVPEGWLIYIENQNTGANTIDPPGLTQIDGSSDSIFAFQHQGCLLVSDGSNFKTVRGIPWLTIWVSTASVTVTNTTTETTLVSGTGQGTKTLPASFPIAGRKIRIHAAGIISTLASPGTLTIKVKKGSTVLASTVAQTPTGSLASRNWWLCVDLDCRSTTTLICQTRFEYMAAAQGAPTWWEMSNGNTAVTISSSAEALDLTAQWGTADVGNSIICTNFSIERLN